MYDDDNHYYKKQGPSGFAIFIALMFSIFPIGGVILTVVALCQGEIGKAAGALFIAVFVGICIISGLKGSADRPDGY